MLLNNSGVLAPRWPHSGVYLPRLQAFAHVLVLLHPLPLQVPHLGKGPGQAGPLPEIARRMASKEPLPYARHRAMGSAASIPLGQDPRAFILQMKYL